MHVIRCFHFFFGICRIFFSLFIARRLLKISEILFDLVVWLSFFFVQLLDFCWAIPSDTTNVLFAFMSLSHPHDKNNFWSNFHLASGQIFFSVSFLFPFGWRQDAHDKSLKKCCSNCVPKSFHFHFFFYSNCISWMKQ